MIDHQPKTPLALVERERKVLRQIAAGDSLPKVLADLLIAVELEAGSGMLASILLISEDGERLMHGAAPSLPEAYNKAIDGIAIGEGVGSCGTAASRGAPVYVSDVSVDPLWRDFRELALAHQLRACWSTPIRAANDQLLGTFAVYYDAPRSPTREELDAIAFVTQTAALAIERHRIDDALRKSQDALEDVNSALKYANQRLSEQVSEKSRDLERSWRLSQGLLVTALPDGTIDSVNPRWTQLLGWEPSEIVGKQFIEFTHPDDLQRTLQVFASIFEGPLVTPYEYRFRHKDGSYRWFAWTAAFEEGKVYAAGRHTTMEREQAEALRQSQKMEAVGQLTGGLAHDFNNLLAGITGSLELMQNRMQQGRMTDVDRYLSAAQGAAKRAAALTHRLLAFSRRQTLEPKPTDVNRLAIGMEDLIQRTVGPAISVETVGASGCWPALVDAPQLENALLNLCLNARDAMPEGGKITIETANKWMDQRAARLHQLPEGQYVSLCVTDTGSGMPREVIDRAFEPFFTTKPVGQGTGLGLSMIYGFAQQSGGQVRIYSEVGQGTTVCIYLPRLHGDATIVEESETTEIRRPLKDGKTVLIVDDEPTVRMLITEILDDLGCSSIEAGDSAAGLKILNSDVPIDLLISDVGLPGGMNGRQMADAARVNRPKLPVLFITGYAENAILRSGQLDPGMAIVTKPFAIDTMAARIRSIIASTSLASAQL